MKQNSEGECDHKWYNLRIRPIVTVVMMATNFLNFFEIAIKS